MKKKILIILSVIVLISLIIVAMYLMDMKRMKDNKQVIFSTWGRKYIPPVIENSVSNTNLSLEDSLEEYSLEQAIKDGCFIIANDNKIYNKDKLDRFIENTEINSKNRIEDCIKIVQFTEEGDPIITELSYKIKDETYLMREELVNKTTYILKTDNTRDRFASDEDRKITIDEDIPGEIYGIIEEKNGKEITISLALYAIIDYIDENVKKYEKIDICSYLSDAEIVQEVDI